MDVNNQKIYETFLVALKVDNLSKIHCMAYFGCDVKFGKFEGVQLLENYKEETEGGNTYRQASLSQCCST